MAAETKFTGTDTYVASNDLLAAVEVATKLQKPLSAVANQNFPSC